MLAHTTSVNVHQLTTCGSTARLLPRSHGGSGAQINCHVRSKRSALQRGDCRRFPPSSAYMRTPTRLVGVVYVRDKDGDRISCSRNSLVDFCCLCSHRSAARQRRPPAVQTHCVSGCSVVVPYGGHKVSPLYCKIIYRVLPNRGALIGD